MTRVKKRLTLCFTAAVLLLLSCFIGLAVFAEKNRDVVTVQVIVNYYYYDENEQDNKGDSPYPSFVANMPMNSPALNQRCPNVPGFEPYYENGEEVEGYVNVSFEGNHSINIFYHPANVPYQITLMKQNLEGTDYVAADVIHGEGKTGSVPREFESGYRFPSDFENVTLRNKTMEEVYEGFTLMYYQPETIAADGSGEFECFFDRNYYQVQFELGEGGSGVDPIYAPYEFPLPAISNPERAGYNFRGWFEKPSDAGDGYTPPAGATAIDLPERITRDVTYIALWEPINEVNYTIVYRNEALPNSAGVTKYNYWGRVELSAYPGTIISVSDIIRDYNNNDGGNLEDFLYFELDEAKTLAENGSTVSVRGDGSTIITLYYSRRSYELKFVYAREKLGEADYPYQTEIQAFENDEDFSTATGYYIIRTAKKTETSETDSHPAMTATGYSYNNEAYGMRMYDLTDSTHASDVVKWKFQVVKDPDTGEVIPNRYYVSPDTSTRQYLNVVNGTAPNQRTELTSTPVALDVTYTNGDWYFKKVGEEIYLSDKKDRRVCASAYTSPGSGAKWRLSTGREKTAYQSVCQITSSTTTGIDPGASGSSEANWWYVKVPSIPTVTLPTVPEDKQSWLHLSLEHETKTFPGQSDTYEYYYVSLVAPFNADIEDVWPSSGFTPMTSTNTNKEYKFGSWGVEAGSRYFELYHTSENKCNIIGNYPIMSSDLIRVGHEDEEVALTLYAWWGDPRSYIDAHTEHIYYESLETPGTYEFVKDLVFQCAHNNNTYVNPFAYHGFEIHPDDAGNHSTRNTYETTLRYNRKSYRLTLYNYNSALATVTLPYGTPLEGVISPTYLSIDPPANSGIDTTNYTFKGWYASQYYDEEEMIRSSVASEATEETIPDHDMILYAYWEPKTYTINYFNDESDYNENRPFKYTEAEHYGTYIPEDELEAAEARLSPVEYTLSDGTVEHASRVGWFYKDSNGVEHAFKPESMTVSGNLDLYMKWTTAVPANYRVEYIDKTDDDHYGKKVASDTLGYSFVGLTKVFHSKVGEELNPGYTEHYFPFVESTSILLRSDSELNHTVLYYAYRDKVAYRVRYVTVDDQGEERQLLPDKTVMDNSKTVVTEKYVPRAGYVPTAYYLSKRLVITEGMGEDELLPQNVITFYYVEDNQNLPYYVSFELENENGDESLTFTWKGEEKTFRFSGASDISSIGEKGSTVTIPVVEFPGYEYAGKGEIISYDLDGVSTDVHRGFVPDETKPSTISVSLADDQYSPLLGKEIHLHYVKKTYPVTVNYRIATNDQSKIKEWNENITALQIQGLTPDTSEETTVMIDGTAYYTSFRTVTRELYGTTFTRTAPELAGFRLSGTPEATLIVSDDPSANVNTIVFSYNELEEVMYYYRALLPDRTGLRPAVTTGLLSFNQESVERDTDPEMTVTADQFALHKKDNPDTDPTAYKYKFVGWYMDENCTVPVPVEYYPDPTDRYSIRPKWIHPAADRYFYARYDYIRGQDLTITSSGCLDGDDLNSAQSFEYRVVGKDLHNQWIDLRVVILKNGSRTVKGLPIGRYDIIPTGWSWRYHSDDYAQSNTVTVTITEDNPTSADFVRSMLNPRWLDGNAYVDTPEN